MPYIYQADLYCDCCGKDIKQKLKSEGHEPEDPNDERSYDSDDYPKYAPLEETDNPYHCGSHDDCLNAITLNNGSKIGCLIENSLTSDGVEYLKEIIENDPDSEVVQLWKEFYSDYL